MTRALIVFGAGPGIGNNVAQAFAKKGIEHIILLARSTDRLKNDDAPFVSKGSTSVKVDTLRIDLADLDSIPGVLKQIDDLTKGEDIEIVFFNAARIKPSEVLGVSVDEIQEDFKIQTLALYTIAQHYIPKLQALAKSSSSSKPALLVTSSHLPLDPAPPLLSLSLNKASQRTMVHSFHRAFAESGVQIGLISVEGVVAPENKVLNPTVIAEKAVKFWEERSGEKLDIRIQEE